MEEPTPPQPEQWLTVGQAAARLGVSIDTLRRWDSRFSLIRTPGGQRRFRASEIDAYLSEQASA